MLNLGQQVALGRKRDLMQIADFQISEPTPCFFPTFHYFFPFFRLK